MDLMSLQKPPTKILRKKGLDWPAIFTASPAALIAFVCCVMPLTWMVGAMVLNPEVRHELRLTDFRMQLLERTLGYNGIAAIIATIMGLPAGFVLGRGRGWLARILWVLLPAALLMPSLSYAYGWSQFVRIVQAFLYDFSLAHFGEKHLIRLPIMPGGWFDTFRCIWSLAAWLWAVPAGLIGLALRRMDTSVQQQAILDGVLYRITLRQLLGPMIASLAVVTVLATQEFAVYEPTGISVVATEVRMVFDTGYMSSPTNSIAGTVSQGAGKFHSPNQAARAAAAVATTVPLLACTIGLAIVAIWGAGQTSASDSLTVGPWPKILDAPRWAAVVTVVLIGLNIGLPVWALVKALHVPFSISNMWAEFGPKVQGAILVAGIATVLCTLAAFSAAGRWTPGLMAIGGASFLIGGQLLAIALIRIYNRELFAGFTDWVVSVVVHGLPASAAENARLVVKSPFNLSDWVYNAFPVTVMAYVGRFGWLALAGGRGTWSASWKELRDMAAVDGAGVFRTAFSVVWPLSWPMLAAGAMLVGALSLTEVPATVLLFPANPEVLTPTLMTWVHMARFDPMIEASLLMMMAVLVPALAAVVLTGVGIRMVSLRGKKTR
jgi:ABC-type Fe3+ transport system permease subunit